MGRRPGAQVRVMDIQIRAKVKKTASGKNNAAAVKYVVRWVVDGVEKSRSFPLKVSADNFRTDIIQAIRDRENFSHVTGLPIAWKSKEKTLAHWAKEWVQSQLPTWEPRSRESACLPIISLLIIMVKEGAPKPPDKIRAEIAKWLIEKNTPCPQWLERCSVAISSIDTELCEKMSKRLYLKQVPNTVVENGKTKVILVDTPRAATVVSNYRSNVRAMFDGAVKQGLISAQPWPAVKPGKKRNKEKIPTRVVRAEELPDYSEARAGLDRMISHQPGSRGLRVLAACCLYAGLRPSEARALRVEWLTFPKTEGESGVILVKESAKKTTKLYNQEDKEFGPPKTVVHEVTMVPPLAAILKEYIGDRTSGLLVETRSGSAPTQSNLYRAWKRATPDEAWTVYDLRHTCATHWLNADIDIKIIADWLAHSPAVLLGTYAGVIKGSRERAVEIAASLHKPEE